jgi:hypothetical protein
MWIGFVLFPNVPPILSMLIGGTVYVVVLVGTKAMTMNDVSDILKRI